ncbi:SMC-Scp complex subunit ScpB [Granulicella sp. WH15]|uniref:SMC-Scp complex subunit ScpB n=1 Tax=Granulicella sp. WH15 TaxID=2602070 RepID=UPI0013672276|nr:SMC-Scp complex subunit ScpB [Granulicella sp. WH15]QHN04868.1 SMC-Scp complex subunit ScpB [Granulicella sp. WH15]
MSLKAKIEAVIYASEEPVTLAQLAGLLGLEAQTELDRLDERQQMLALEVEEEAVEAELLEVVEEQLEAEVAPATEPEAAVEAEVASEASPEAVDAPEAEPETVAEPETAKELTRDQEKNRERRLREYFRQIIDELIADYATSERGLEIREVAGGLRMATKPEYHDAVRGFVKSLKPALKLSLQALETLAVVAYKQPVTAPEVSEIRGVDSAGVLGSLMGRKLITTAGRKQVIGRPILYKTTKDFLLRFGLKDIQELPSIEEFEKMAGELADIEPVQKEIPMAEPETKEERDEELRTAAELEEERYATAPQADGDSQPVDVADAEIVDGRVSGLPPRYGAEDSSAQEADVQREAETGVGVGEEDL